MDSESCSGSTGEIITKVENLIKSDRVKKSYLNYLLVHDIFANDWSTRKMCPK